MQILLYSSFFADMSPHYYVDIPPEREPVYACAPAIMLVLAMITGGLWLARGRSTRTAFQRALILFAMGSLLCSYTAWWIWSNHDRGMFQGYAPSIVAYHMPLLWIIFAIIAAVVMRRNSQSEKELPPTESHSPVSPLDPPTRDDLEPFLR
jgi:hypothetical protein